MWSSPITCSTTCPTSRRPSGDSPRAASGRRLFAATNGRDHLLELWELLADFEGEPWSDRVTSRSFELENAPSLLSAQFSHVELRRYEDGLAVTEAEPLVAYVLSTADPARPTRLARDPEAFRQFVQRRLESGPLRIRESAGLFQAWN